MSIKVTAVIVFPCGRNRNPDWPVQLELCEMESGRAASGFLWVVLCDRLARQLIQAAAAAQRCLGQRCMCESDLTPICMHTAPENAGDGGDRRRPLCLEERGGVFCFAEVVFYPPSFFTSSLERRDLMRAELGSGRGS